MERILFCGLTSLSLAGKPYIIRTGFAVADEGCSAELSAEIIHERGMNGRLAFFAGVAKTLGNRTETSHETGQEIAVEKFLYGTHGVSLILFFVSRQRIFCSSCRRNGQFCMTVM
ncbi:hypothetical protein [Rhizobium phaseoli]|uniref:hypothetical protein n=1 Tax=Rhizobium phaseoli TaxID=396 RepID=UPI00143861E2|nr:hypothetical protein [Rhizobium phaseoli]MDK4724923.1 hypothetical protein [Rhizobium phaseoli]NKE87246.1 hypothetical protein [Rhizobium phaseoli]